jgi:DNA polymerase family A
LLHLDFETRSVVDLEECGLSNYAANNSTEVLLLAWAFDNDPVAVWEKHRTPELPKELVKALHSDEQLFAWNAPFERNIFKNILHVDLPPERWVDPMVFCRFLSLPGSLEKAGRIVGLPEELQKSKEGHELINLFCYPADMGGEPTLFGLSEPSFYDWNSRPRQWEAFKKYCAQDVVAEREIYNLVKEFPLPEAEYRAWYLDQLINERGLPVNLEMIDNGLTMINRFRDDLDKELQLLTGSKNPNSRDQMLEWIGKQGYPFNSLHKDFVTRALLLESGLTKEGRKALELRQATSRTSYKKFEAIKKMVSLDRRLRHQFIFLGASRTGRWSGTGPQFQNLPRPEKAVKKNFERAFHLVMTGDYEAARKEFPAIIGLVTSLIRSVFQAPPGKKLVIGDLSAIENRVIGWLAGCTAILDVFRRGFDPYLTFAALMYRIAYDDLIQIVDGKHVAKDKDAEDKRQVAKPAVLGAGYGLSAGVTRRKIRGKYQYEAILVKDKYGNSVKTGLLGYAENMGVTLTPEQAYLAWSVFRESYPEVVKLWSTLENAAIKVLAMGGIVALPFITFERVERKNGSYILRILLPSGRHLHYINARLTQEPSINRHGKARKNPDGSPKYKTVIYYDGIGHGVGATNDKKVWGPVKIYGGKFAENIVQAISRDILLHAMFIVEEEGGELVGHVHDELICLSDDDIFSYSLEDLKRAMSITPSWAPGLPLAADGFESKIYRK